MLLESLRVEIWRFRLETLNRILQNPTKSYPKEKLTEASFLGIDRQSVVDTTGDVDYFRLVHRLYVTLSRLLDEHDDLARR